jgi:NAD(P)-dependent dehydrogenase (short-subunit alcohol dehydrogenase family)
MAVATGTRVGAYEILGLLGAGGMGEVYRARDTKLNRDVAPKIVPESFVHDPDRVGRFTREAQVLASLNPAACRSVIRCATVFSLQHKVAVVTGAGSGIGKAIAVLFASRGARLAVLDVRDTADATVAAIRDAGGEAIARHCDVSDPDDVARTFHDVGAEMGRLDILVNNAGIAHVGTIEQTTPADLDRLYGVNVRGVFLCSKAALEIMLPQGRGVILNMASIASLIGVPERFAYSMTKGAVLTMTMSVAIDYVKRGIRCNCICPARVQTPFVDGYLREHYPGREEEMRRVLDEYQPIGRMCTPEEVASLALYLCSDEAAFVTGQAYPIDGGVLVS